MKNNRKVSLIKKTTQGHWVGDGFPVRTMFSYRDENIEISPFLLFDYAGPQEFPPTKSKLGVGEHPHRGFETVTIVYSGEVEHRDSSGGGGKIGPGEVQWMTAASGLVHEEFHGAEFAKKGGRFEMIQLWVNLPKKDKMTTPRYQTLTNSQIKKVELPNGAGNLRVIAGNFNGTPGPAKTFTHVDLWDVQLNKDADVNLPLPDKHTAAVFVLNGEVEVAPNEIARDGEFVSFKTEGEAIELKALAPSKILVLSGEPIHEPIVGAGPFVMNTEGELKQAFIDYQNGRMGHIPAIAE